MLQPTTSTRAVFDDSPCDNWTLHRDKVVIATWPHHMERIRPPPQLLKTTSRLSQTAAPQLETQKWSTSRTVAKTGAPHSCDCQHLEHRTNQRMCQRFRSISQVEERSTGGNPMLERSDDFISKEAETTFVSKLSSLHRRPESTTSWNGIQTPRRSLVQCPEEYEHYRPTRSSTSTIGP